MVLSFIIQPFSVKTNRRMEEFSLAYKVMWSGWCNLGPALSPASPPRAVLVSELLSEELILTADRPCGDPYLNSVHKGLRRIQRWQDHVCFQLSAKWVLQMVQTLLLCLSEDKTTFDNLMIVFNRLRRIFVKNGHHINMVCLSNLISLLFYVRKLAF